MPIQTYSIVPFIATTCYFYNYCHLVLLHKYNDRMVRFGLFMYIVAVVAVFIFI
jgi:hypothetical protein